MKLLDKTPFQFRLQNFIFFFFCLRAKDISLEFEACFLLFKNEYFPQSIPFFVNNLEIQKQGLMLKVRGSTRGGNENKEKASWDSKALIVSPFTFTHYPLWLLYHISSTTQVFSFLLHKLLIILKPCNLHFYTRESDIFYNFFYNFFFSFFQYITYLKYWTKSKLQSEKINLLTGTTWIFESWRKQSKGKRTLGFTHVVFQNINGLIGTWQPDTVADFHGLAQRLENIQKRRVRVSIQFNYGLYYNKFTNKRDEFNLVWILTEPILQAKSWKLMLEIN